MLDKSTTQRLRSLPVEAVAERLGLRVVRHKSLCPFHDDHHASLSYSPSRNTFRCFVCDARGGTIDLVMRHLNMSFPDACRWLANGTNIILDTYRPRTPTADRPARPFDAARYARLFEHPWLSDEARTFLFTERRLNPRVISWCRLTSWTDRQGTHWLQTPYFDASGQLIGLQNRNLDYGKHKKDEGEETGADNKQGQGVEGKQEQAVEGEQGQGSEDKQEQAIDGKQEQAIDGKQGQAVEGEQGQGSEGKQGQAVKGKQGQAGEGKQGQAVEDKQGQAGEGEGEQGQAGEGKQGQAGEGKQGQAIKGKQEQAVEDKPEQAVKGESKKGQGSESREAPRFRFPYGSRCTVYNLPVTAMLRPGEPLFITEGCSDCWAMLSAGHKAIAIPSATLLSQADKTLLRDLAQRLGTSFHMFPDRDAPGERLFMQLREVLPGLQHHQLPVDCKDFAEYYVSALAKNKLGGYG